MEQNQEPITNQPTVQNRWKSPVVWAAVAAQITALLVVTGILNTGQSEAVSNAVAAVLQLLVIFGVLNNPTNQTGF